MKKVSVFRLLAVTALGFALTATSNTVDPLLVHKMLRLAPDNTNTMLGLTSFAGLMVAVLVQPIAGVFSDRTRSPWGRRIPYVVGGALLTVICLFLLASASLLWVVVAGVLLQQFFSNSVQGPWQALIPDQVPEAQRGQAAGIKGMFDIIALMVGSLSAGQFISRFPQMGQTALLLAVSVPAVLYLIALVITVSGAREAPDAADSGPSPSLAEGLRNAFRIDFRAHPEFGWWFANRILFWASFIALNTFLLVYLVRVMGMAESAAQSYFGTLKVVLGAALALVAIPSGWLSDRIGRKPLVVGSGLIAGLGTVVILLSRNLGVMTVGGAIVGIGVGTFISASWALITDIVPREEAARYLGVANIASAGGSGIARLLGGLIIDPLNRALGSQSAGYLVLYGLAAACFLLSALALAPLPSRRRATLPGGLVE